MDDFLRATESLEGTEMTTCRVTSEDIDRVYLALAYDYGQKMLRTSKWH